MNKIFLPVLLLGACFIPLSAQTPALPSPSPTATHDKKTHLPEDIFPVWSVVGDWHVTHPVWSDIVTIRVDGTFIAKRQGTTGHWVLSAESGTPLLVMMWDEWGTESAYMIGPNHFRGQTGSRGKFFDMRRGDKL